MDQVQPSADSRGLSFNWTDLLQNGTASNTTDPQNQTQGDEPKFDPAIAVYTVTFLIVFCVVSLVVNLIILSSVCFMRLKVQPTLYISISLAAADTFSLFLFGLGLVLFSLLPRGFNIVIKAPCLMLLIETIRMGAIVTTMLHLVALAGNHYLGILKPLGYPLYMTGRNLKCMALVLWTLPSTLLIIHAFIIQGSPNCSSEFLKTVTFRTAFSLPFFTTLGLMSFIYCHIYILVKNYQKKPLRGRCLTGKKTLSYVKSQVNKKAIVTTLMILGSVICGWMPAFTYYALCCQDCLLRDYWQLNTLSEHIVLVAINFLMIAKTATNSYIYACRMKELKIALRGMKKRVMSSVR